jgi:hypothetical protein
VLKERRALAADGGRLTWSVYLGPFGRKNLFFPNGLRN